MAKAAQPEVIAVDSTLAGYSILLLAKYKGQSRRYWWRCAGCWDDCADDPSWDKEDVAVRSRAHAYLCPESPSVAEIGIRPAA